MLLCTLGSIINPNIALDWLNFDISLSMCDPASFLLLGESCPARGWQCYWEIKEHTGLWLGGMLQRHSSLWTCFFIRYVFLSISSLKLYLMFNENDEHDNAWMEYRCFHCMINNYASMHVLVQSISIFIMCMFMGLVSQVDSSIISTSHMCSYIISGALPFIECGHESWLGALEWDFGQFWIDLVH